VFLEQLDISECPRLQEDVIFKAKEFLGDLEQIDISKNSENFSIQAITCLCSYPGLRLIVAREFFFDSMQLLFLRTTFDSLPSGNLKIITDDNCDQCNIENIMDDLLGENI